MNKKVTIQDVANAAGVCKATVSYVLNDNKNQSISEATKKKVWQVVNILNYRPNTFAQNMRVTQAKKMIGVYYPKALSTLERVSLVLMLEELTKSFRDKKYGIVLLESIPERVSIADAIVTIGVSRKDFFALGECNYIPIISVDCPINDSLFFEISWDCDRLKGMADDYFKGDYAYVCPPPRDNAQRKIIQSAFHTIIFADKVSDLMNIPHQNIFVTDSAFREILLDKGNVNVLCPDDLLSQKTDKIAECVQLALSHETYSQHIYRV